MRWTLHQILSLTIPNRWMIEQIVQPDTQILFDSDAFSRWNIPISVGHDPSGSNSTDNDVDVVPSLQDAVQPITSHLWKMPLWWTLETFPTSYTYQNAQDKRITTPL
jgi:hypothetical protein